MKSIEALHLWEKSNSHNNNTYKYVLALAILDSENIEILRKNPVLFQIVTILKCAKFLEDYNVTPHLTGKIPFEIKREPFSDLLRHSFELYRELLKEDSCFYCGSDLKGYHKDHFIPWEYVLEHKIWNLVPSCPKCNNGTGGKFTRIPEKEFLDKLLE